MLTVGSLCSGYGGLDLAVETVFGATTVWVCEYDKHPSTILEARFPGVPNHSDLTTTNWSTVEPVDILTAGYPCQPFSHAGKRQGTNDDRHLWPFIADAIRVLRPGRVCLENVAGHLSLGFGDVLGDLAALGYDARWGVVRAADAGAPHNRARVFILADANGEGPQGSQPAAGRVLFDGGAAADTDGEGPQRRVTIERTHQRPTRAGSVDTAPNTCGERHGSQQNTRPMGRLDGENAGPSQQRERSREVVEHRSPTTSPHPDHNGSQSLGRVDTLRRDTHRRDSADITWGTYEPAIRRWEHTLGRSAPAPTEPGRNGPRLAPEFVEWMMGLPQGWVTDTGIPRNAQLKALGNGVVPQQAALAYRTLVAA